MEPNSNLTGVAVLICAQLAAASTASCVKALPDETPSVLRGLWRQTLTSFIFTVFSIVMWLRNCIDHDKEKQSKYARQDDGQRVDSDKETSLLIHQPSSGDESETTNNDHRFSAARLVLVTLTIIGATLLNDTIVIALRYASSAAVMCLCNTSEMISYTNTFNVSTLFSNGIPHLYSFCPANKKIGSFSMQSLIVGMKLQVQ